MSDTGVTEPDLTVLTTQLCEALNKLAEAKADAKAQEAMAKETLARYHALFDEVSALQTQLNETIKTCLNVSK